MNQKEYWVFIDDSGNVELSSSDKFFVYAALIFDNYNDVIKFRNDYKNILIKYFQSDKEIKAASSVLWRIRKKIYSLIITSNCKIAAVVEDKLNPNSVLSNIEEEYKNNLKLVTGVELKGQKAIRQVRKNAYGRHKSYLIGQLICLMVSNIKKTNNTKINIITDRENLLTPGNNFDNFSDYLKYEQKYLKLFTFDYSFKMENSKKEYCLQGSDFLAHSIYRLYNQNDNKKFNYIDNRKKIVKKEFPYIPYDLEKSKKNIILIDKSLENDNI